MPIVIERLGSSTVVTGSGRGSSGSAIVSPIVTSGRPASATISPGPGLVGGHAVERLGDVELGHARVLDRRRRRGTRRSAAPLRSVPWRIAQQREAADVRARVEVRDERLQRMVGVVATAPGSSRGSCRRAARGRSRARRRRGRRGRRARSRRRSGTRSATRRRRGRGRARRPRSTTSSMRASGRSTLLTTSTTGSCGSSALRSTKRVCGSGPSLASTSSRTPSTIVSPRSTSPPKSAWPGVSTMLIFDVADAGPPCSWRGS